MHKIFTSLAVLACLAATGTAHAQFNRTKAISAGAKVVKAATVSDKEIENYVKEYVVWMDKNNPVCEGDDPYAVRLEKITEGFNNTDGLNIKAYRVRDVNAFACADGSIRVMAGLMEIMSDEEILGVIGHEIGHIKNKDTKDAFKTALMASALRDGVASAGGTAARLSDSQLGELGEAVTNSKYSQKQEYEADEYGYNFLKSHSKNPWAMAMSFEKLQELEAEFGGGDTSKMKQLLSTHPDTANRAKKMAEKATKEGFERPEKTEEEAVETVEAEVTE